MNERTYWVPVFAIVALFVLVGGLFMADAAYAQEPTGASPAEALSPGGEYVLEPGESVWYAFQYGVERKEVKSDDDEEKTYETESPRMTIRLSASPSYGTHFEVWSAERLRDFNAQMQKGLEENEKAIEPVGRGTANEAVDCECFWAGEFNTSGTYYVRVFNDSTEPSTHVLYVEGTTVTYPQPAAAVEAVAPAAEMPAAVTEPEPTMAGGTSPEDALPITDESHVVGPGESVWYAFQYGVERKEVDKDTDNGEKTYTVESPRVTIQLFASPSYGTHFEVWSAERLRDFNAQMQKGLEENEKAIEPVGRGTANEAVDCECFWAGEFNTSGTYYVHVINDSMEPSTVRLVLEMGD